MAYGRNSRAPSCTTIPGLVTKGWMVQKKFLHKAWIDRQQVFNTQSTMTIISEWTHGQKEKWTERHGDSRIPPPPPPPPPLLQGGTKAAFLCYMLLLPGRWWAVFFSVTYVHSAQPTFLLHWCLPQSRRLVQRFSHRYSLLHSTSFWDCPQRQRFSRTCRHCKPTQIILFSL